MLHSTDERCLPLLRPITLLDCRTVHSLEHNSDNFSKSNLSTLDILLRIVLARLPDEALVMLLAAEWFDHLIHCGDHVIYVIYM